MSRRFVCRFVSYVSVLIVLLVVTYHLYCLSEDLAKDSDDAIRPVKKPQSVIRTTKTPDDVIRPAKILNDAVRHAESDQKGYQGRRFAGGQRAAQQGVTRHQDVGSSFPPPEPNMTASHPDLSGKWILVEHERFEEYLAANGAPWVARKAVANSKSALEIEQGGSPLTITIKAKLMMGAREDSFTIGVPAMQTQQNGAVTEVLASWDGDKFVVTYTPQDDKSKPQSVTRSIVDGRLITILQIDDIVAKRVFERMP